MGKPSTIKSGGGGEKLYIGKPSQYRKIAVIFSSIPSQVWCEHIHGKSLYG